MLFTSDRPVKELNDFVDYVWSFYGEHDDTLYPIHGLKKKDIYDAFFVYEDRILKGDLEYVHYEWGDGDSLDRERVRDILIIKYGYDKEFYGGSVLWEDFQNEL